MKVDLRRIALLPLCLGAIALAQPGPRPDFGRGGPPPGFGPGGPEQRERKLVKDFDTDGDKRLNTNERKAAREFVDKQPRRGPFGGRFGGEQPVPEPGRKLTPGDVKSYGKQPLYDAKTLRTLFLEFENPDWEDELASFYNSDVEVPATLSVDGKTYRDVGVHFRGMSSFMMAGKGRKRSLNLSLDFVNKDQRLGGYRTLNLLNSSGDPTFLRSVLFLEIARQYIPAPKANYMRVVINGESWGVYVSAQQFNTDFVKEWFNTTAGARWKVPGSPRGRGGLEYLGDQPAPYKRIYEIKSKDDPRAWADLINLCKVLNQTPPENLEKALEPILDIDGALKFLALEKAMINTDGYWTRASDYNIYQDTKGRFHIIPHDANETLRPAEAFRPGGPPPGFGAGGRPPEFGPGGPPPAFGPGGRPPEFGPDGPPGPRRGPAPEGAGPGRPPGRVGPPRVENVELDPFAGEKDADKPLLSKLLAVPELRDRYLAYMRDIAAKWLDWNKLAPLAREYQSVIAADIKLDTRKLSSTEAFSAGVDGDAPRERGFGPGAGPGMSLKTFVQKRREYLVSHPELKKLAKR